MSKTSIKKKILIRFYGNTLGILLITMLFVAYYSYRHDFIEHRQPKLLTLAKLTASLIDSSDFNKLVTRSDEKSEEYKKIKDILNNIRNNSTDIKYIYTMRKTGQKDIWEFVVDAEDERSDDFSHLGDKFDVSKFQQMKNAFNGPSVDQQIETDQWGSTLSGYAPIRDKTGRAVGIVGLDIAVETITEHQKDLLFGLLGIIILSFGITAHFTSKRIKGLLKPVNEIIEGAKQVTSGNFEYRMNIKTGDEFEIMGNILNYAADVFVNNNKITEKDLQNTKEQRKKIFKVYSDVIFSVTQGKFNLISYKDSVLIAEDGIQKSETKLEIPEDVGKIRDIVERYLTPRGFSEDRVQKILFCISEAATNVIKHAKEGVVQIRVLEEAVRLVVLDHGPGMDFDRLPNMIFFKGFSTKISLGVGFSIIYRYADKVYLSTSKNGTFVAMDFNLEQ